MRRSNEDCPNRADYLLRDRASRDEWRAERAQRARERAGLDHSRWADVALAGGPAKRPSVPTVPTVEAVQAANRAFNAPFDRQSRRCAVMGRPSAALPAETMQFGTNPGALAPSVLHSVSCFEVPPRRAKGRQSARPRVVGE